MSKRESYKHTHADEQRRRQGALERLELQLFKLNTGDSKYLFLKGEAKPTPDSFKTKIAYVTKQISNIKNRK